MLYALGALIAIAVIFFLLRGKGEAPAQLPPPEPKKAPVAEPKKVEKPAPAKEAREEKREKEKAPAAREPAAEVPSASKAPTPPVAPEPAPVPAPAPAAPARALKERRDVSALRLGLAKSRGDDGFFGKLKALFGGKKEISTEIASEIEELLLASDVGVKTTEALLARVKAVLPGSELVDSGKVWDALREETERILSVDGRAGAFELRGTPTVVLMVGVNGAGKTTTIGKLATKLKADGKSVVLAAGDTFRAAAVQQLSVWGDRVGCTVVKGKDGADPGAVIFDAIKKAQELGADVVLADTAGRLHTRTNLMTEMKKVAKTLAKAMEGAPHETLLVLDATNGQNALAQAKEFKDALDVTGLVVTKLDGTAKGGVVVGICNELAVPVKFIGLGERSEDLREFSPEDFAEALLGSDERE